VVLTKQDLNCQGRGSS